MDTRENETSTEAVDATLPVIDVKQNNDNLNTDGNNMEINPVGFAIKDFGRSLRNMAMFLLILDVIAMFLIARDDSSIKLSNYFSYDKFNADFYTTVSRELAGINSRMNIAHELQHLNAKINSDISYYISGLLVNITLLTLTVGRGIFKIGKAMLGEAIAPGQTIIDSLTSKVPFLEKYFQ